MPERLDLLVIGTGVGAGQVAQHCREAGWDVAIVDRKPYGGTCMLRGCEPKKVLVAAADAVDRARKHRGKGVSGELALSWRELMEFKRTLIDVVPEKKERAFSKAGIQPLHGAAQFVGPTTVAVGDRTFEARHAHIAPGAKPVPLPIEGAEHLTHSDAFLELEEVPRRVLFLGSGYISFEFAHIACAAGAEVVMAERASEPLSGFDPDLVQLLVRRSRDMGIFLHVDTDVEAIERRGDGLVVHAKQGSRNVTFETDCVVHGAGRVPDIDDLALERGRVEADKQGIIVNEYMQSVSNPAVYAAGDAAQGGLPLTPVAGLEAHIAARNLVGGNVEKITYPPTPSVVFTLPSLASVGLQESEAHDQGLRFAVNHAETSSWYSSRREGEACSGYKVLIEEGTGRILGAHMLGHHAEDAINVFALAMQHDLTRSDLADFPFAFPTAASDLRSMV